MNKFDRALVEKAMERSATPKEMFIFGLWNIFSPKKRKKVVEQLKKGATWRYAFDVAKNMYKNLNLK